MVVQRIWDYWDKREYENIYFCELFPFMDIWMQMKNLKNCNLDTLSYFLKSEEKALLCIWCSPKQHLWEKGTSVISIAAPTLGEKIAMEIFLNIFFMSFCQELDTSLFLRSFVVTEQKFWWMVGLATLWECSCLLLIFSVILNGCIFFNFCIFKKLLNWFGNLSNLNGKR